MLIRPSLIALLGSFALVLAGCAEPQPAPTADAAPAVTAQYIRLNPPKLRPRRVDKTCKVARVDLRADRVTALFEQFHAELAGADADVTAPPAAPPLCQPLVR